MIAIETIGERIKALRKSLHISQAEFGQRIGVKQNTVATWESGVRVPSDVAIRSISREFSADEDWLRRGVGELNCDASRREEITAYMTKLLGGKCSELELAIIDFMSRTDVKYWYMLLDIMKSIADSEETKPPDA